MLDTTKFPLNHLHILDLVKGGTPDLYDEGSRRQYFIFIVSIAMMVIIWFALIVVAAMYFAGIIDGSGIIPLSISAVLAFLMHLFTNKSGGKYIAWIPSTFLFLLGMYGSAIGGIRTTFLLAYALCIMLAGFLMNIRWMFVFLILACVAHFTITGCLGGHDQNTLASAVLIICFLLGIAFVEWFAQFLFICALKGSYTDSLTHLYNRSYFDAEVKRLKSSRAFPVSIVIADINKLKTVNDTKGHAEGDKVIQAGAAVLEKSFRADDIICRIGGDEFSIVLRKTTADEADQILSRLRENIKDEGDNPGTLRNGIAIGVITVSSPDELDDAFQAADEQMYQDKTGKH